MKKKTNRRARSLGHAIPLAHEVHIRFVGYSHRVHALKPSGSSILETFNGVAAEICQRCIDAQSITPDTENTEEACPKHGSSARPTFDGCRPSIMRFDVPADVDAAFGKVARLHGLSWAQAFAFAVSWIVPASVKFLLEEDEE